MCLIVLDVPLLDGVVIVVSAPDRLPYVEFLRYKV